MHQIISVLLLFSVLINSTGFILAQHFCGETLEHISLNETKTCCEEKASPDSEEKMPDNCCHNEFSQLLLDHSQLDHQTLQLQPLTYYTISLLTHLLSFSPHDVAPASPWTTFHSPPLPRTDVYLRVQSFLI